MNFMAGQLENGDFVMTGCRIERVGRGSHNDVILGARPEDIKIVQHGESHINAILYSVELTGDQTIVTAKLIDSYFTVREDKEFEGSIDQPVKIRLDKSKVFLFDRSTGERIRFY
jgi:multiple sugar transport system ATP-binding protein